VGRDAGKRVRCVRPKARHAVTGFFSGIERALQPFFIAEPGHQLQPEDICHPAKRGFLMEGLALHPGEFALEVAFDVFTI